MYNGRCFTQGSLLSGCWGESACHPWTIRFSRAGGDEGLLDDLINATSIVAGKKNYRKESVKIVIAKAINMLRPGVPSRRWER